MKKSLIIFISCILLFPAITSLTGCAFGEGDLMRTYPSDYECVQLWMDPTRGVHINEVTYEVETWKDQSDNGLTFQVQSGAPYTMYNGYYQTMYFDTGNGYFYSGKGLDIENEMIIFVVADLSSGTFLSSYSGGTPLAIKATSPDLFIYPGYSYVQLYSALYPGMLYLYEFHIKYPSADVIINGGYTIYGSGSLNNFYLDDGLNIGSDSGGSDLATAYIGELIICDSNYEDDEITGIRNYLMKKFNITPW